MNSAVKFPLNSKSKYLTADQIEAFGAKIDAICQEVMDDLGEKDAKYIYKVRNFVRYTEIASRGMLMFAGWLQDGCHQCGCLAQVCSVYLKSLKIWSLVTMSCTVNMTG